MFSLSDPARFKAEMEEGGFSNVTVDFVSRDLEVTDFDTVWGMLTTGTPPVQVMFDQIGEAGRDKALDVLGETVEERYGSVPIRLSNTATVGQGWPGKGRGASRRSFGRLSLVEHSRGLRVRGRCRGRPICCSTGRRRCRT